jgi:hypothetical protein
MQTVVKSPFPIARATCLPDAGVMQADSAGIEGPPYAGAWVGRRAMKRSGSINGTAMMMAIGLLRLRLPLVRAGELWGWIFFRDWVRYIPGQRCGPSSPASLLCLGEATYVRKNPIPDYGKRLFQKLYLKKFLRIGHRPSA